MDEEMSILMSCGIWELMTGPVRASIVTCRWVYTTKHKPDGSVDRYKARLVACGFTQTYGVDYAKNSSVARLNSIRVLLSVAMNHSWDFYQLDVKNAFFHSDLIHVVLMEQPPGYVGLGEDRVCRRRPSMALSKVRGHYLRSSAKLSCKAVSRSVLLILLHVED